MFAEIVYWIYKENWIVYTQERAGLWETIATRCQILSLAHVLQTPHHTVFKLGRAGPDFIISRHQLPLYHERTDRGSLLFYVPGLIAAKWVNTATGAHRITLLIELSVTRSPLQDTPIKATMNWLCHWTVLEDHSYWCAIILLKLLLQHTGGTFYQYLC